MPRKRRTSSVNARMSDSQRRLAHIWAEPHILNRSERMFVPQSNFFEEGGDSIKAQEMFFLVKKEWHDRSHWVEIGRQSLAWR
jgi:L-2-aminoadipate reductase